MHTIYKSVGSILAFCPCIDETYALSHDSAGVLGMANKGRNTNASQFYITLKSAPWMDGQYVAFG